MPPNYLQPPWAPKGPWVLLKGLLVVCADGAEAPEVGVSSHPWPLQHGRDLPK